MKVDLKPALVTCSLVVPLYPVVPLHSIRHARASGQDQIYTEEDRSQPPVTCHRSCVSGVGTQISRLFGVLKSTCYILSIEVHKLEKPQLLHEDIEANTI